MKPSFLKSCALAVSFAHPGTSLFAQTQEQSPRVRLEAAKVAARNFAEELRAKHRIPGLSIAVARRGELVFAEGFGLADIEQSVRVTPATKFRIASLSKLVTVAALARCIEKGRMTLDDRVTQHVPYWPEKRWPILIRQLAAHTSGIRHYRAGDPIRTPKHYGSVRAGLRIFAGDKLLFEPGTGYSYSSYAYNLLSATIEGACKESFLKVLQEEVLDPLGMRDTIADQRFRIIPKRTRFYSVSGKRVLNADYVDNSYKWAGGGLLSTPRDLVKLGLAICRPGHLKKETLGAILAAQPGTKHARFAVGVGWRISRDKRGRLLYHHGGAITGGRGYLIVQPEGRTIAVILANLNCSFGRAAAQRLKAIFEDA